MTKPILHARPAEEYDQVALRTTLESYDREAQGYADHYWSRDVMKPDRDRFLQLLSRSVTNEILDFGCGPGHDTARLRAHGARVVGLDGSGGMLRAAHRRAHDLTLVQANFLANLPFRAESFTGIWACSSLLHVPYNRFRPVLQDLSRILRPDGVLFVSLMKGHGESIRTEQRPFGEMTRFFSFYSLGEVLEILEEVSFPVISATSDHRWVTIFARRSS
jgi:SAM-dependent methyltransferase